MVLAVAGCSGDDGAPKAGSSPSSSSLSPSESATLLQPGSPGEPNQTVSSDDVILDDKWNHTDVAFCQMMIPHHAQALVMSELAPTHAKDSRVKSLASRILAGQRPEILFMSSWLEARDLEVPQKDEPPADSDHGEHGADKMHGMLTDAQLADLRAARGSAFDRLFLKGMIQHHRGALMMASDVAKSGQDVNINSLADDVNATQSAEINRMRDLLKAL